MTMSLFDDVADLRGEATLQTHIEAGNLAAAMQLVEALSFNDAFDLVLMSGFSVVGGKRDKKSFYEHLGRQLIQACSKKTLPINENKQSIFGS